ncbi:hypothetical protein J6590_066689 [Homalodisca vitripennis]|nr:hypothetical protein J6590_066689 [Homalodisca vitripennis]
MIHTARSNTQATLTWTDRQDRNGRQTVVEGERSMSLHAVHRRAYASRDLFYLAHSLLIRRHSELSATDWDTGILARFITPPLPHPPRRTTRRGMVWQRPLGHKLTSRRALKQTVHKTAQKLLTHESMGASTLYIPYYSVAATAWSLTLRAGPSISSIVHYRIL